MTRKRRSGRIVASAVAVLLACGGVFCLLESHWLARKVRQSQQHRPVDIVVDLSEPGEYTTQFRHTWSSSHFTTIGLLLPERVLKSAPPTQLLAGLEATFAITAPDGTGVVKPTQMVAHEGNLETHGFVLLSRLPHFRAGEYGITVEVLTGAQGLSGVEQRLQAHYLLCGLEMAPAALAALSGIGLLVIAGIIGIVVLLMAVLRSRQTVSQPARSTGAAISDDGGDKV